MHIVDRLLHPFRPNRSTTVLIRDRLDAATSHADLDSAERAVGSLQRSLGRHPR